MCEGKNRGLFLTNLIIMLVLFLSMIYLVFNLSFGDFFNFELFLIVFFLILALIMMYGVVRCKSWAWKGLLVFYGLNLINSLILYFESFILKEVGLVLILSGVGYMIALTKSNEEKDLEIEEPEIEEVKTEKKVKKEFKPGKFVASKTGSVYHAPKCDWAKRIKKKNQVWFDDQKEAKKNFKPHSCLK